jgi:uncharacterized protein (DUF58 family)
MTETLAFGSDFLKKLESLFILSRKLRRGSGKGEHISSRRGYSLEFAGHRDYSAADDFRYVDWNVSSRLEKLFVKIFQAQEEMTVYLLVDSSSSMAGGAPSKLHYARCVAASLAYIALSSLERVFCGSFSGRLNTFLPLGRNRSSFHRALGQLSALRPEGATDLDRSLSECGRAAKKPGMVIVISDMLDGSGFTRGLKSLLYNRLEVSVIQVLDPADLDPGESGPLRIQDRETGRTLSLTVDEEVKSLYRRYAEKYVSGLKSFCMGHGMDYLPALTDRPFIDLVLEYLRKRNRTA